MPAAIPIAAAGISLGGGLIQQKMANKALKKSQQLSPEGMRAQQGMFGHAGRMGQLGGQQFQQGSNDLNRVGSFWQPMLAGSRGAIDQSLAPEMAGISDIFRGATRNVDRTMRGASADVAKAELNRDRASQLALLRPQARLQAAGAVERLGTARFGAGLGAMESSGNMLAQLYQGENAARMQNSGYAMQNQQANSAAFGRGMGGLLFNIISGMNQRAPLPTTQVPGRTPPYVPYPSSPGMNRPW